MNTCQGCKKKLKSIEKISCTQPGCGKNYYLLCVNLNTDYAKKLKSWNCPDCTVRLLSVQRKDGNFDSTPVKMASCTEDSTINDEQNITFRRTNPSASSHDTAVTCQDFILRSEISSIMRSELRAAIRDIFDEELSKIRKEIQGFQESIAHMNDQFDNAVSDIRLCIENTKLVEIENITLKNKVSDLETRLAQVEQDARQNNLEIHCLPEHKQENLVNTITQLCKVVSYPVTENDILFCNRVQKFNPASKMPRTVICKLASKLKRDNLLAAVLSYNKANPKQKLNTKLLGYGVKEAPVFVSEHLTPSNKSLHAATRMRAKEKQFKFVWIRNGKIFVRKDESSPALVITHNEALQKLVN